MNTEDQFFDSLARRLDWLSSTPGADNEATRHDQLIHPILVSPWGLGWRHEDLLSQPVITVPSQVVESHIFRNAIPRSRRPDLLIAPPELGVNVAVVEEKARQHDLLALNDHRLQVTEYQSLFECVWGILSDGEKWIVRRNFERYHEFADLNELKRGIRDLRYCISRTAVIERWREHGTCDLVILASFSPTDVIRFFVGNLPFSTVKADIEPLFGAFGRVIDVVLPTDRETGRPRGFALVSVATAQVDRLVSALNGFEVGGRPITVNEARP